MKNTNEINTPKLLIQHGYRYHSLIGEGSNGKTYCALNMKTGENVAIKALKFNDSLKNYELFKREAEVLKSLNHPGIPRFFEYITSETEFTECWIVQEYIEGKSIQDMLEEKQAKGRCFSIKQTIELIYEAACIVQMLQNDYVPAIIHRDIKPSNILIRKDDLNDKRVCLIDFGAVANPQKRNNQSTVAGTVGYMAPEQLVGNCAIQSDYYSLGATALHMLTGIVPSDFPSDGFELHFEEILKNKDPNIPDVLVKFLKSLMAPQIADRPQNADALIEQMNTLIDEINRSTNDAYLKVKKKYQNLLKANEKCETGYSSAGAFIIFFGFIFLLMVVFPESMFLMIFFAPIVIGYFIAMHFKPKWQDPQPLKKKLAQFNVIDVQKALPREANESDIVIKPARGARIANGTISAIHGNYIDYYYIFPNRLGGIPFCNHEIITDDIRKKEKNGEIKLKAGEKVIVEYWSNQYGVMSKLRFE